MSQTQNELLKKLIARIYRSGAIKEYHHTKTIALLEGYELRFALLYFANTNQKYANQRYASFRLFFDDVELATFSDPDEVLAITEALDLQFDEVKKDIVSQGLLNL